MPTPNASGAGSSVTVQDPSSDAAASMDTHQLLQTLRRIGSASPNLTAEANSLAERVMGAEAPIHGDTTKKNLVAILRKIMRGRSDIPSLNRRIKQFVHGLEKDVLTNLSESIWGKLSLEQQEDLLQQALRCGDVGDYQEDDSDSAMHPFDSMSSKIGSIDVVKSRNEILAVKAKKRIKKARQRIDQHDGTIKWIILEDVIDEVKATGVTDHTEAERCAQRIWEHVCFLPDIYRKDDKERTKAEFMLEWLQSGYTWDACIAHLKTLTPSSVPSKRRIPENFKTDALKRLRTRYVPRGWEMGELGDWGNLWEALDDEESGVTYASRGAP